MKPNYHEAMVRHDIGPVTLAARGVAGVFLLGKLEAWISHDFARSWYADAKKEAESGADVDAKRRQILFSVALAETYLFEWVRDEVLQRDHPKLDRYFPPGDRKPVLEKWKAVPKKLLTDGLVTGLIDYAASAAWRDFGDLVDYRNGLSHGRASRPASTATSKESQPVPSRGTLDEMQQDWPLSVVVRLIEELHASAGTKPPAWLAA